MPDPKLTTIYLSIPEIDLSVEELWPDGLPDEVTEETVREALEECGKSEVLSWFLYSLKDIEVGILRDYNERR